MDSKISHFLANKKKEKNSAFIKIKRVASYLDKEVNKFLEPHKITEPQYNILRILKGAQKPITVNTVKERMIRKSPNATRLMDKLLDKMLIERFRCENDRRIVYVKISAKGLQLLENIKFDKMDNPLKKLTEKEVKMLNYLLDKIKPS